MQGSDRLFRRSRVEHRAPSCRLCALLFGLCCRFLLPISQIYACLYLISAISLSLTGCSLAPTANCGALGRVEGLPPALHLVSSRLVSSQHQQLKRFVQSLLRLVKPLTFPSAPPPSNAPRDAPQAIALLLDLQSASASYAERGRHLEVLG